MGFKLNMDDATASMYSIFDLLPHRGKMLLINKIIEVSRKRAVSSAIVKPHWPMFDGEGVSSLVIIELVAQTAGLSNGLDRIIVQGADTDKKGWLVGIKASRLYTDRIELGAEIIIKVNNRFEFDNFREIEGIALNDTNPLGEVTLQVIQADPDESQ